MLASCVWVSCDAVSTFLTWGPWIKFDSQHKWEPGANSIMNFNAHQMDCEEATWEVTGHLFVKTIELLPVSEPRRLWYRPVWTSHFGRTAHRGACGRRVGAEINLVRFRSWISSFRSFQPQDPEDTFRGFLPARSKVQQRLCFSHLSVVKPQWRGRKGVWVGESCKTAADHQQWKIITFFSVVPQSDVYS